MARTVKPTRLAITRYVNAEGRQCSKSTPGARKVTAHTDGYYARFKGRKPINLHTTDQGQAWINLRALMSKENDRRAGIVDDTVEHARTPFEQHVEEWLAAVRTKKTSEGEIALKKGRLLILRAVAGWKRITDITEDSTADALARLQDGVDGRPGVSAQTRNHYTAHVRQFTRWLTRKSRLRKDPLLALEKINVEADRRHDRRCPTDAEIAALLAEVDRPDAPVRRGMSGPQRALGYRVSMATGFRAGELRRLTRESFDLASGTVKCRAAYSKNKKVAVQHLPPWLVAELEVWFAGGGRLWDALTQQFPGRVLKADLAAAGVAWMVEVDGIPLFFDFHAPRVWYISWAASLPGISPKTLMEMARHSDPRLTLRVYAKAKDEQVKATVAQLPRPGGETPVAPEVGTKGEARRA